MTSLSQKPKSLEVKSGPTFGLSVKSLINLVMGSLHILIVILQVCPNSVSTASLVMFMMHASQTEELSRSEVQREDLNRFN